jgi:high affinity Mn2+ porin
MFKKIFIWGIALGVLFYLQNIAFAENTSAEISELKARIAQLEKRLTQQEGKTIEVEKIAHGAEREKKEFIDYTPGEGMEIKPAGLIIGAGATLIVQATNRANGDDLSHGNKSKSDISYSADLEFEKAFDDYGMAFLHLETGAGGGIEDSLRVFSNVNRDADDSDSQVSLTEVWYEHYFKNLPLTLTFGKIDPTSYIDTNEYANDECTQFLGHIFRNSPALEFPDDNAAGARILLEPVDFLGIELAAMDAKGQWKDVFDNMFFAGQINFKPNILERQGNYRVYGWLNKKDHIKWADESKTKEDNYGIGLSIDQEITDILGFFARYGWQNPKVYFDENDFSLEHAWSAGLQLAGNPWGRDDDVFGIAFGQAIPSDDYKKANDSKAKTESHLEAYYNFKVNEHLSISPDMQIIWDPYGSDAINGDKTIFVGGLRMQVDF